MTYQTEDAPTEGPRSELRRVGGTSSGDRRYLEHLTSPFVLLVLVAAVFALAQLVLFDEHRFLEWDEAVYVGEAAERLIGGEWAAHRALGMPWLIAPLYWFTSSFWAMRIWLIVTGSVAVALGFSSWLRIAGRLAPLGLALFCSNWLTLFYGSEASPNLYVAAACVWTVGQLVQIDARTGRRELALLSLGIAVAVLFRPTDGIVLAAGVGVFGLLTPRCRRDLRIPAAAGFGFFMGFLPWIIDAVIRFGGPIERWRSASSIVDSSIRWQLANHVRLIDGPLVGPDPQSGYPVVAVLMVALMVGLAVAGTVMSHLRGAAATSALFAALVATPYLFYVGATAPRFLLPAFALLAMPVAIGMSEVGLRSRAGGVLVGLLVIIAGAVSVVQANRVEAEQAARRDEARVVGEAVRSLAAGRDCLVLSQYGSPQIGVASECSPERLIVEEAGCQLREIDDSVGVVIISFVGETPTGVGSAVTDEFIDGPSSWRSVVVDSRRAVCSLGLAGDD